MNPRRRRQVEITLLKEGDAETRLDVRDETGMVIDPEILGELFGVAGVGEVQSVNGHAGSVVLVKGDVGLGNVDNTSDAGKPISTAVATALSNKADLVGGVLATSQIPSISVTDFLGTVSSQAAMLALTGQKGDFCIRSDVGQEFVITGSNPTQLESWIALPIGVSPIQSVNGQVGAVVLGKSDVGLGNVDNTSDVNKPVSTPQQTALDLKANVRASISAKTGAYTVTQSDSVITADATSSAFSVTIPTAVGVSGKIYIIKRINTNANAVTVATTSSQTIDGSTTYVLTMPQSSIEIISDGANWRIVSSATSIVSLDDRYGRLLNVESFRISGMTDNQVISAAIAAVVSGTTVRFESNRTYTITSQVVMDFSGKSNVTVDFSTAKFSVPSLTGIFMLVGGTMQLGVTTASASITSRTSTITVVNASSFVAGDIIRITSSGEIFNPERPTVYFKGELARVSSVSGNTITLASPTLDTYDAVTYTVNVGKMSAVRNLKLIGGSFVGAGSGGNQHGVQVRYFDGATITGLSVENSEYIGLQPSEGFDLNVTDFRVRKCNKDAYGYGITLQGVHGATITASHGRENRHSFDTSGAEIPSRQIAFEYCTATNDRSAGISTHGNTDGTLMVGNRITDCGGGIVARGSRTKIDRNIIVGTKTTAQDANSYFHGISLGDYSVDYGVGRAGYDVEITNNYVDVTNPNQSSAAGQAASGLFSTVAITNGRIKDNTFVGFAYHGMYLIGDTVRSLDIEDNIIDCSFQYGTAGVDFLYGIAITPTHSTVSGNNAQSVRIRGNKIISPKKAAVWVNGNSDNAAPTDDLDISDNRISGVSVAGQRGVNLSTGYYGSKIRINRNMFIDSPNATAAVNLASLSNFVRPPLVVANEFSGVGSILGNGMQRGTLRPGLWYSTEGGSASTTTMTVNQVSAVPIYVPRIAVVNGMGIQVTTGVTSSTLRFGIADDLDDGYGGYPGNILYDSGGINSDTSVNGTFVTVTGTSLVILKPGLYWMLLVTQGGSGGPVVQTIANGAISLVGYQATGTPANRTRWAQSGVTGALPSTFTSAPDAQGAAPMICIKTAS